MAALSIITPCSRPQNLSRIWPTLPPGCQWLIILDRTDSSEVPEALKSAPGVEIQCLKGGGSWGNPQRNRGLSLAKRDYVYFLDDDNIVHPKLMPLLAEHAPSQQIIVVNQHLADGTLRLKAAPPVEVTRIDTAQVLIPRKYATEFRWKRTVAVADGLYFAALYAKFQDRFLFLDVDAAYYNYLR
ncbi:MAG TPA: glycosyltransferase family 2 protein [Polyangiaceae bacterium]|nr:glycosyltransferase family 2 protein [Polyangiaceae bacterium]